MEVDVAHYARPDRKFQAATSPSGPGLPLWIGVVAVVLLSAEAATQTSWTWLAVGAIAAAGFALRSWQVGTRQSRAVVLGLATLALAQGAAATRLAELGVRPAVVADRAVGDAIAARDRAMAAAIAAGRRTAAFAVQRVLATYRTGTPMLDDLLSRGDVERGIVVRRGDSVITTVGPVRIRPVITSAPAVLTVNPFGHFLTVRESSGGVEAQVTLLLDASPSLPAAGESLLDQAGRWQRVRWKWDAAEGATVFPTITAATTHLQRAIHAVAPSAVALVARDQRLARILTGAGLGVLALLIVLSARDPAIRAGAVLVPLWALSRVDAPPMGSGPTALQTLSAAAAIMFVAILLWRRPPRRAPVGMIASVLLLASAMPLVVLGARAALPVAEPATITTWFWWQVILAVATAAFLAVANAPLRAADDIARNPAWGACATAAAILVGALGIEAWTPTGWSSWYPVLWSIPLACMLPRTSSRSRMVAIATTAGVLATLATWTETLEQRMQLARADIARLQAPQPDSSTIALDAFAAAALTGHATRIDRLYAEWRASRVAALGLPTHLALWSGNARVRESIALDSLSMTWGDLTELVAGRSTAPQRVSLRRGAVHHEVLVLPLAPDTIATVTIGPRSRLVAPTRFGRYVGWRSGSDPAFQLAVVAERDARPDSTFRRSGRWVRADWQVAADDAPRVVRATIEMATPRPFAVRAALSVLLDVLLIFAVWIALERVLGREGTMRVGVFQRSYRRTVATALAAFFIVPALFFTLWSLLRLRGDAAVARTAEVTRALRNVAVEGGFAFALDPVPKTDSLNRVADVVDADIAIYRESRLVAASTPLLVDLGLLASVVSPLRGTSDGDVIAVRDVLPHSPALLGLEVADNPTTLVATVLPGTETQLARDQMDLALLLLLVSLTGAAAAVAVAGAVARALGQPIDVLRRAALAIGRGESPPPPDRVPAEFAPVFGAIDQMETQLRGSTAALEAGRARTAAILSTVATGVIGVDAHGEVIHANPRAEELLGVPIAMGRTLDSQLPAAWHPVGAGVARLLGPTTRDAESREIEIGEQLMAVTLAPLGDGGLVIAITDITEASRAARIVAWGEMARQVAHEIKNPLTPMRLGLQHLRRVQADGHPRFGEVLDETVTRLLTEIDRLDRIARSFARYGAPPERTAAPLEPVPLRAAIDELSGLFALTTSEPRIRITGGEAVVATRREELVQVLLNLLDNARHAGASDVELRVGEEGTLVIRDNGAGIAVEQLGRIFEPSFSTTTSGTGLGLAIVRRLVEGWGASIGVSSAPGDGATFTVRFAPPGTPGSTPDVGEA